MIKPKGYLYVGLGILGAVAMGIGCANEEQASTTTANKASHVNTAQPEAIKVEIMMEDAQRELDAGVSAEQAPTTTAVSSTSLGGMPNSLPAECSDPTKPNINCQVTTETYAGGAAVGPAVGAGAPGVGAGIAPGIGGPGFGGVGPGFGGIGPGIGGVGPGFAGDVPYGPGLGGPWFGLGHPFYVTDFIIVDDDSHRRRHHHDDDANDDEGDDDAVVVD